MRGVLWLGWALILAGCGGNSSSKLVGSWVSTANGAVIQYHFRPDGTFSMDSMVEQLRENASGRYALEGNTLVLNMDQADVQGPPDQAAQAKSMLLQGARVPIEWTTPGTFRILLKGGPVMIVSKTNPNP